MRKGGIRTMHKRTQETPAAFPRWLDIKGLQGYLSLGAKSADRIAQEAGAKRRIPGTKSVRYDRFALDDHLNMM